MAQIDSASLARAFYRDLHSSASENFVASLLAASLNESARFRRWLAIETAQLHGKLSTDEFFATANHSLPRCIAGKKTADHIYSRPDIIVWDLREEDQWDPLYEYTYAPVALLSRLHAVFVELKWEYVSPEDQAKYLAFLDKIEKWPNLRFILVVSLTDTAVEQIRQNPAYQYEKPLHVLFNDPRVTVITYFAILAALNASVKNVKTSKKFPATMLARDYFVLLTCPQTLHYWRCVCANTPASPANAPELRDEIVNAAVQIALHTGYISRYPRLRYAPKNNWLHFVGRGGQTSMKYYDGVKTSTEFRISVGDNAAELRFDLATITPKKIATYLSQLTRVLTSPKSL